MTARAPPPGALGGNGAMMAEMALPSFWRTRLERHRTQCQWKKAYPTWQEAERACEQMVALTGDVLFAYLHADEPGACGQWHVAHDTAAKRYARMRVFF